MPFLGTTPLQGFVSSVEKQSITNANGVLTDFTLTHPVANENDLEVFIGNVRQEPGAGKAYTAAGTTLSMSEAPAAATNFYVIFKNQAQVTTTPPDGSVSSTKLADGSVSSTKLATNISVSGTLSVSTNGVDFSANTGTAKSGATTSSELLNHYEQGTWAPVIQGSTSNPTYSTSGGHATGKFVRIGNLVYIQWSMHITGVSGQGGGNAQLMGLPYPAVCQTYEGHIGVMYNDVFSNETQKGYIPNGSDYLQLVPIGRTQTNLGIGTLSTGYFGGGGHYLVG
tara:strand:+ start:378 stop:1223 length:846 start_codon:yes stop_codon:yes gene_type:complete